MATIKEVSELAKVSQATVSRVVNGYSGVSYDKRVRVEEAMKTLGYRPNSIAKALASNRTGSIGLVVPELAGPFYSGMMHNVEAEVRKHGYHLIITAGGLTAKSQREAIDFLLSRRVDGLILHTQSLTDDNLIDLVQEGVVLSTMNRFVPEIPENCVYLDNELGGLLMTRHLHEMGHSRIACISGPMHKTDARSRLQGYRSGLEEVGLSFDESLVVEGLFTEESGCLAMKKLLARNIEFSAVFCCNDHMAFGAAGVLRAQGYNLPNDMSVAGFDNIGFSRYTTPGLTTVNFPVEKMSEQAVHLVLKQLGKKLPEVQYRLTPKIVVRESVDPYIT